MLVKFTHKYGMTFLNDKSHSYVNYNLSKHILAESDMWHLLKDALIYEIFCELVTITLFFDFHRSAPSFLVRFGTAK